MQGSEFTAQQGAQIGVLVGGACGTFIGLAIVIAAVIYFARRQREAAPLSVAACPKCGSTSAKAVTYAWWGGLLGPKLLSHVECTSCRTGFNSKTGQSNTVGIVIYVATSFVLAIGLVLGALVALN